MQFDHLKRRDVLTLLAGAAAFPRAVRAQQRMPVLGNLVAGSRLVQPTITAAFNQGLKETGFVEGQNLIVLHREAEGRYDRLPRLAMELVARSVDVITASPGPAAMAAKAATRSIPIVFAVGTDPVETGLVASINRPGGNVTGVSFATLALMSKRIEVLHELVPPPALIAALVNPSSNAESDTKDVQAAALALGRTIQIFEARTAPEIDTAFAALIKAGARAFVLGNDAFLSSRRNQIVALAIRHAIPAIYPYREYATAGGMMSYGTDRTEIARQHGTYVGRVLKGEKPADLPVMLPTKFELVVNLTTAKAIGFAIPETFLLRADEVIE